MHVAVAGASGLIGSALVPALREQGHTVRRLVRRESLDDDEFSWDPETFGVPPESLDGVDAVVGLGGVGVGNRRWSGRFKQELRDSRIIPTQVLADAAANAGVQRFLSASATGYYGDTGTRAATEADAAGSGFLPELVTEWESAATSRAPDGPRTVLLRTAPVLAPHGGMLGRLRRLFGMGLGGTIGDGSQYFSWITLADEVAAIGFLLESEVTGPVNLSAPQPVPFAEFVHTLGHTMHRPAVMGVPAFAARVVGGEMAQEMILASQRIVPAVLTDSGFGFAHTEIGAALEYTRAR